MRRAGDLSAARRAAVLAVWLLLLGLGGWVIARTPFTADLSAFLPAQPDARQRVLIEQLQSGAAARTLLLGIEGGSAVERAQASRALAQAMRASGRFEQVNNGADLGEGGTDDSGFREVGRWLFEHRYQLSPAIDAARFTPEGLREGIAESLSLLGTPAGNAIKPLLDRDPTGETQRIAEALIPAQAPRSEEGVWASRRGGRAVLLANVAAPGADLDAQAAALDTVRQAFAAHLAERAQGAQGAQGAQTAALKLRLSGTPVFSVDSRAQIEREVKALAIAGTLLMSALLLLAFGSPLAMGVALLPVLTGVVAGIAAVGLGFGSVHGVTLGFGSTLIGEAVDYAIYYLIQAHRPGSADPTERGWRHWLRHSWPTVRLGLLTSVCGFAALAFSGFPGLAQLGVFSCAGLLAAALATRFVLPVLLPDGTPGRGARHWLGRAVGAALRVLPRWRRTLLALGVVAGAALLWQRGALWTADLAALSPISAEAMALDESLRADLMSSEGGSLVVAQGPDLETTLQRAEAAAARLDRAIDEGRIAGYSSVTRWLPSQATQQRRQASLPEADTLRAALAQATAGGPLPAARLEPFVQAVQAARGQAPVGPDNLRGSALAPLVAALLLPRADGSWAALLPVQAVQANSGRQAAPDPAALRAELEARPGVQWLEIKPELDRMYARYLGEARAQALLGALGVVLLVGLWLRSGRRLLAVCRPLLLALLLTLGLLTLLRVPLGILHLVGLLLVVAVGSNYALFFDMLQHEGRAPPADAAGAAGAAGPDPAQAEAARLDTLASLALANLTTVLSFGLIALSTIPALSAIGRVVAPGALLALVLAAAFAPRVLPREGSGGV